MNAMLKTLRGLLLLCAVAFVPQVSAQDKTEPAAAPDVHVSTSFKVEDMPWADVAVETHWHGHHRHGNAIFSIGHDATLAQGERADAVVAIFGSATNAGEVSESVVSVLGNAHVTGSVGQSVAAVLGNVYVNGKVHDDVVAILGNVELGPLAEVDGEIIAFGGQLKRDPAAIVQGNTQQVFAGFFSGFEWLHPWVKHCLLYGRPLALQPGLGWAWGLAFGFLALYVLFAVMFRSTLDRCAETLESRPGRTTFAAILAMLFTPLVFLILCITVIGILFVPFFGFAWLVAGLFGKAAILAVLGRRITRHFGESIFGHTAVAVLIGGALMLALYLVPVVGFIAYKLLGILGLGVVVYTWILTNKANKKNSAAPPPAAAAPAAPFASPVDSAAEPLNAAPNEALSAGAAPQAAASLAAPADATLPRAGFWVRMAALILDTLLVGLVTSLIFEDGGVGLFTLAVYGAIMWKLKGSTIGGIIFGLQVVRLDGRPVDWATAGVRALSCFLSLVVAGLGFLWIAFDDERQGWHDKIAGTVVVKTPKRVSLV